ncbi:patched-2 protein, putative, partial [Ixodes scapularis]
SQGRASGARWSLELRSRVQLQLLQLGRFVDRNAGKVLFVGLLVVASFCVGLKSAHLELDVNNLWVQRGGRLEREQAYVRATLGDGVGTSSQLVIQTSPGGRDLLRQPQPLLAHLDALRRATAVTVDMFDVTWRLKDVCYAPNFPVFDEHYIDAMLEKLLPCVITTPLDCFWEGSKIMGPEGLGSGVQWTDLNPQKLVSDLKKVDNFRSSFPFDTFQHFMKRAGITTAYQEKPCLNPADPRCPKTAPNKQSGRPPDIGAELTGGCYGFATNFMHWPEDLIVGGCFSRCVCSAEALQSVVQLMAERDMYQYWKGHYRMVQLDWSIDKARAVLEAWQRNDDMVQTNLAPTNLSFLFSIQCTPAGLPETLHDFSEVNPTRVPLGCLLMMGYAWVVLWRPLDPPGSRGLLGALGVLLAVGAVGAGLGLCALLGLPFNAATTRVLPFLALGLGLDNLFLLAHAYEDAAKARIPPQERTGQVLKCVGTSVLLVWASTVGGFVAAALIPVPALRAFVFQAALLHTFAVAAMLLLFPAAVSVDLRRRRRSHRLCCWCGGSPCLPDSQGWCKTYTDRTKRQTDTVLRESTSLHKSSHQGRLTCCCMLVRTTDMILSATSKITKIQEMTCCMCHPFADGPRDKMAAVSEDLLPKPNNPLQQWRRWSLSYFVSYYYAPFLQQTPIKVLTVLGLASLLSASAWGALRADEGLALSEVVPGGSQEQAFLRAQGRYFGFFHMFAVTRGNFEYPTKQRLLLEYHEAFTSVEHVIKNDDGGLPDFWLTLFRDWLLELQAAFDQDWEGGCITREQWFPNASDEGVLAYKLLVQTGRVDNPIDKTLVLKGRLVDAEGLVNPKGFYNYLSAWASNDALAYAASQANLRPEPRQWVHSREDVELRVPKSAPLAYAQMPFYLRGLRSSGEVSRALESVWALCGRFEARGLPNFPSGAPFAFWEHHLRLRSHLLAALALALAAVFLVVALSLLNLWAACLLVLVLASMVLELFGAMGFLGVGLSAVPAVVLVIAVGIGVHFTAHITVGFLTSIGSRNRRVALSLDSMFAPVVHGAVSTLLGVLMLAFSEFDFIVRHFFYVLSALIVIGLLNGLLFLPIILSLVGPPGEVVPKGDSNRISTPSPQPSPEPRMRPRHSRPSGAGQGSARGGCTLGAGVRRSEQPHPWADSLSTISEE